ncbi:hypothetical protein TC41_1446 [Alicyclobacillus acidocaldarius subsp. acidocaldarius Tc-4-1]|uniref:Uncharacterized protein n=1 Tax=Alicyclobacillus acidocaldarius (strain Tc-4-1) TaxID=1048834 RepID=F8IJ61_ALIAT|nr:hypothetical protein TC41_1446 [Alicyclobacillus acidocaldarius subsp. acidocaldarius Tc-4-1]
MAFQSELNSMEFKVVVVFLCHVAHLESTYSYILDSLCPLF